MVEESVFRGTIDFFQRLGVYDVVLPFLLVFTIVFAIMEKTKIFGTEQYNGKEISRKNMNAMAAFVMAFFVVASSQLVSIINQVAGHVVLLLFMSVCFLMLAGSFHKQTKEGFFLEGGYKKMFMVIMFIGIILIFLNAIGWLETGYEYVKANWDNNSVAAIVLMLLVIGLMYFIIHEKKEGKEEKSESK